MKSPGTSHWLSPNTGATNSSGFSAYPAGYRNYDGYDLSSPANRTSPIDHASFWTTDEAGPEKALGTRLVADSAEFAVGRYAVNKSYGYSVRCVKD